MQLRFYLQFSWCAREDVNCPLICYMKELHPMAAWGCNPFEHHSTIYWYTSSLIWSIIWHEGESLSLAWVKFKCITTCPKHTIFNRYEFFLTGQQGGVGIRMPDWRPVGRSSCQAWKKNGLPINFSKKRLGRFWGGPYNIVSLYEYIYRFNIKPQNNTLFIISVKTRCHWCSRWLCNNSISLKNGFGRQDNQSRCFIPI